MSPLESFPELTDVSNPVELETNKPVYFKSAKDTFTKFYFIVSDPQVVKVDVWPLDAKSDPDLYIRIDNDIVTEKENDFR